MIRYRPGFTPVETQNPEGDAPPAPIAAMRPDMIPALNRKDQPPSDAAGMSVKPEPRAAIPAELLAVAPELKAAPEIITNPNPSPTPHLTNEE